jgi:hypothetical protein
MTTTVTNLEEYDLVVLGGGEGDKYLAWTLARKDSASSWSANGSAVPFQHRLPAKKERDSQAPRSHRFSSGAM